MLDHAPRQQVFISFSTKDLAVAEEVQRQLVRLGFDSLFLSADPINGIRAGDEWRRRLEMQLRYARVFLPLISANWIASSWCHAELRIAKFMGMSIFPVRIGEGDTSGIADELQDIRVRFDRGEDLEQLRMLLSGMLRHRRGTWKGQLADLYPAAAAYQESEAAVFFGRDAEIAALARAAVAMTERAPGQGRVLLYTGASGVGKSSLVRAGLIPDLKMMASVAVLGPLRPADGLDGRPESLTHALARLVAADGSDRETALVAARGLLAGSTDDLAAHLADRLFSRDQRKLVIVVDQAEEIAHGVPGADAQWALVETLLSASRLDVAVVLTVRLDTHPDLLARLSGAETLHLPPIQRDNLRQVLKEPLRVAGLIPVHDDPAVAGFIDAVLEDAEGAADALPLVSQLMAELVVEPDKAFSGARYRDTGGLRAAIARSADRCLEQASGDDAVAAVREAFLRMVAMDGTGAVRLARLPQAQLPALARPVIQAMAAPSCRLLRVIRDEAGEPAWEPTHESLLRLWPRLAAWLDEERLALATISEIRRDAAAWLNTGQVADRLLHRGDRLRLALVLAENDTYQVKFSDSETDYLRACDDLETALMAERRHREKQVSDGLCLLLAKQAIEACGERIWPRALRFALAGWLEGARNGGNAALAQAVLARAAHHSRQLVACRGHEGVVIKAACSPDGGRIATASSDGTTRIFDAASGVEITRYTLEDWFTFRNVSFSPDGKRVVTVSTDRAVRILDATTCTEIARYRLDEEDIESAAFSPDGTRVVILSLYGNPRIIDAATGTEIVRLDGHDGCVWSAVFSPDGRRLVTASDDRTARIFDVASGAEIASSERHEDSVLSAVFSPEGDRVVTASHDGTVRIFSASTGGPVMRCSGHKGTVTSALFFPDGLRVLTVSRDGTARIFDAETGAESACFEVHGWQPHSAVFSANGRRLVVASGDKTVRIFDSATGLQVDHCDGHESRITSASFMPGDTKVVSASCDRTARIFDVITTAKIIYCERHKQIGWTAAFSSDGSRMVTMIAGTFARIFDVATGVEVARCLGQGERCQKIVLSFDGMKLVMLCQSAAHVFDSATGMEIARCDGHEGFFLSADFSPDGTRLVVTHSSGIAKVYDAATGLERTTCGDDLAQIICAALSPDGACVVTGSYDGKVCVFNAETGAIVAHCYGHEEEITSVAFSHCGRRVVTTSEDCTTRVFDVATCAEIARCEGHEDAVHTAAFSPDGERVVTASNDKTARIFDAATGLEIVRLDGHEQAVLAAAFSPGGDGVVTASEDGTARIFDVRLAVLSGDALVSAVCREKLIGDEIFTQEEVRISSIKSLPTSIVEACLETLAARAHRPTEAKI